jgi:hypothetical protein
VKPRARRIALLTVAAGFLVVGGFVVVNWGSVCTHLEAWQFQLTSHTETIEPDSGWPERMSSTLGGKDVGIPVSLPQALANCSGRPVIVDGTDWKKLHAIAWRRRDFSTEKVLQAVRERSFRVVEQRFPRRVFVVRRDEAETR